MSGCQSRCSCTVVLATRQRNRWWTRTQLFTEPVRAGAASGIAAGSVDDRLTGFTPSRVRIPHPPPLCSRVAVLLTLTCRGSQDKANQQGVRSRRWSRPQQSEEVALTEPATPTGPFSGRTPWSRSLQAPLRAFLQTESGSAGVLLLATVAALAWANLAPGAYASAWETPLTIRLGDVGLTLTLREWVNSGLMTFFFFVVGLEARREFDLGELRQRRRVALPVLAGIGGMTVPVVIFLAINSGRDSAAGWGTTMSTDTAFALGLLALVARGDRKSVV